MVKVGIIGCGYWGPNLVRNFSKTERCKVVVVCDLDDKRLAHMKSLYPGVMTTRRYETILEDSDIDAVCIATPVATHFHLALQALKCGKHVLVEKPLCDSSAKSKILVDTAKEQKRILMAGHTFLYSRAIEQIRDILSKNELGKIYYISMERLNLGLFQKDINVVWDLAVHDITILKYITNKKPIAVSAIGRSNIYRNIEDMALITLEVQGGIWAHIRLSWLDPHKVRKLVIVGSEKMLVYDDIEPVDKITIFDKGVNIPKHYDTFEDFKFAYRYGGVSKPLVDTTEPLWIECNHFLDCIEGGKKPKSDGEHGVRVIKVIEAIQDSIKSKGAWRQVQW